MMEVLCVNGKMKMKRSQMISIIHNKLIGTSCEDMTQGPDFASKLLNLMEEVGMIPPPFEDESLGYNRSEGKHSFTTYEWESEDNA